VHAKYTCHCRQSKLPVWYGVDQLLESLIFQCAARITVNIEIIVMRPKNLWKEAKIDLWVYITCTADDNFIIMQVIKEHIGLFCFSVKPHNCNDHDSYICYSMDDHLYTKPHRTQFALHRMCQCCKFTAVGRVSEAARRMKENWPVLHPSNNLFQDPQLDSNDIDFFNLHCTESESRCLS